MEENSNIPPPPSGDIVMPTDIPPPPSGELVMPVKKKETTPESPEVSTSEQKTASEQPLKSGEEGRITLGRESMGIAPSDVLSTDREQKLIETSPELKAVGKENKAATTREILKQSSAKLNDVSSKIDKDSKDVNYLSNGQIQQYKELHDRYESEQDPKVKKDLAKQLSDLEGEKYNHTFNVDLTAYKTDDNGNQVPVGQKNVKEVKSEYIGDDEGIKSAKTVGDVIGVINNKVDQLTANKDEYLSAKKEHEVATENHLKNIDIETPTGFLSGIYEAAKANTTANNIADLAKSGNDKEAIKQLNNSLADYDAVKSVAEKSEQSGRANFGEQLYGFYNSLLRPVGASAMLGVGGSFVGTPAFGGTLADSYLVYDAANQSYSASLMSKYAELKGDASLTDEQRLEMARQFAASQATTSGTSMIAGLGASKIIGGLSSISKLSGRAFTQGVENFGKEETFISKIAQGKQLAETIAPKALGDVIKHAATIEAPSFVGADIAVRKARGEDVGVGEEVHQAAIPILMSVAMNLIGKGFGGGKYLVKDLPSETKMDVISAIAAQDPTKIEPMIEQAIGKKIISQSEANDFRKTIDDVRGVIKALPSDISPETFKDAYPLVKIKQNMEAELKDSETENPHLQAKIEAVDRKIQEVIGADLTQKEQEHFEKLQAKPEEERTKSEQAYIDHYSEREKNFKLLSAERLTSAESRKLNKLETKQEGNEKLSKEEKADLDYLRKRRDIRLQEEKTITNDTENKTGLPSEGGIGKESVETQPKQEGSGGETKGGGVVQGAPEEVNIFEKIEQAKRSKKSAKEKQNAAREAVKDMGEVGEKAIFVDENFNDRKQKLNDLIKQGKITNLKIEC